MIENINFLFFKIKHVIFQWIYLIQTTIKNNTLKSSLILLSLVFFIYLLKKIPQNTYWFAFFTLPATIMHELTHLVLSIITFGKPRKMSLIPKKTKDGIIYGYVESTNIKYYNALFIGLSPLILLILGIVFVFKYLIPEENIYMLLFYFYISLMFIEGGIPSKEDVKIALISWPLVLLIACFFLFIKF